MAQQYIYNKEYVDQINEQVYREIGISQYLEQFSTKGINPSENIELPILSSTIYESRPIKNVINKNATKGKFDSIIGFGVVIFTLLIIYFTNKILFWILLITFIVCCISFVTGGFGNIKVGDKELPL